MHTVGRRSAWLSFIAVAVLSGSIGVRADVPLASPESVGFSTTGIEAFRQA